MWRNPFLTPVNQGLFICAVGVFTVLAGVALPGLLLFFSGFISMSQRLHEQKMFYNYVLDALDAELEAKVFRSALMQYRTISNETGGMTMPVPASFSDERRKRFLVPRRPKLDTLAGAGKETESYLSPAAGQYPADTVKSAAEKA